MRPYLITIFFLIFGLNFVPCSAQRFGYIDTDFILSKMPDYKKAQDEINQLSEAWEKEIQESKKKIDGMYSTLQAEQVLLTEDMKKRSVRLRENLALPEPEKSEEKPAHAEAIDDSHLKKNIVALHDLVVSFVANPLFKNLGVVDAKVIDDATENLNNIIECSDEIKREAKSLGKSAKK